MSRLEGSRWRLRRAREMRLAMEFEWVFFRLFFGAKPECRHFHARGEESQIPPHTSRIISRAASAAPAASFWPSNHCVRRKQFVNRFHATFVPNFLEPAFYQLDIFFG